MMTYIPPTTRVVGTLGQVLSASGAVNIAGSTAYPSVLPMGASYELLVNVSAVAGAGTLDLVLQTSPDNGTTWINLPIRTAQLAAQGQYIIRWSPGMGSGEAATASAAAATGGALAQNCTHIPNYTRFFATIGGTSVTANIYVVITNLSNVPAN